MQQRHRSDLTHTARDGNGAGIRVHPLAPASSQTRPRKLSPSCNDIEMLMNCIKCVIYYNILLVLDTIGAPSRMREGSLSLMVCFFLVFVQQKLYLSRYHDRLVPVVARKRK